MLILFVASFNMEKENLNLFLKLPALYKMKGVIMICEDTLECFLRKTFFKNRFLYNFCISSLTLANSDAHPQCVKDQFWNHPY